MNKKVMLSVVLVLLVCAMLACGPLGAIQEKVEQAKEVQQSLGTAVKTGETAVAQITITPEVLSQELQSASQAAASAAGNISEAASLKNVKNLAPVHIAILTKYAEAGQAETQISLEGDIDAKGNSHYIFDDGKGSKTEFYMVDGKEYIGAGSDNFVEMGKSEANFEETLMTFGGAPWIGILGDFSEAKKLGEEAVNGFNTQKYEMKVNPASLGAGAQAGSMLSDSDFQYTATAWVEPSAQAVVKAQVDISSSANGKKSTLSSALDITKADVAEITAPKAMQLDVTPGAESALPGTSESSGAAATLSGTAGQPVTIPNLLELTVNSVNESEGNADVMPSEGNTFLLVNVTIKNISADKISADPGAFEIQDANKAISYYYGEAPFINDNLKAKDYGAGGSASGTIVFEIAKDSKGLTLVYSPADAPNGEIINIDLGK
jgi:hypothetical protein